ncbi:hypothetical protein TRFO_42890 [Tritrichomonas foetus]|uniref:Lipoprotein n=1 Tax=Tritrichomonas foetus TaxID=1144522 RepID=A0A1J4KU58_9EUKA|nr:hypothetical protein TRFO_42890 [Tritrichomonas foetus]|eukprot:OHT14799.1 hypothetical protein TRFO_42890 [Tritrichomonas foetus]
MSVLAVSLIILSITCCGKKEKVGPEEENSFDIKVPNDQSNVKSDDDEKNIKAREIYFGNLPGEGNSNDKNDNTLSRKSTVAIPKYFEIEPANHSSSLVMIPRMNSFIKK